MQVNNQPKNFGMKDNVGMVYVAGMQDLTINRYLVVLLEYIDFINCQPIGRVQQRDLPYPLIRICILPLFM